MNPNLRKINGRRRMSAFIQAPNLLRINEFQLVAEHRNDSPNQTDSAGFPIRAQTGSAHHQPQEPQKPDCNLK